MACRRCVLPRPDSPIDEEGVVGLRRRLGDGDRRRVGETVRRTDDERVEEVLGVQARGRLAGTGRRRGLRGQRTGRTCGHAASAVTRTTVLPRPAAHRVLARIAPLLTLVRLLVGAALPRTPHGPRRASAPWAAARTGSAPAAGRSGRARSRSPAGRRATVPAAGSRAAAAAEASRTDRAPGKPSRGCCQLYSSCCGRGQAPGSGRW